MDLLVQLQDEVTTWLDTACDRFNFVPFRSLRRKIIAKEVDARTPHLWGKNNRVGVGCLVGMPVLEGIDPNVSAIQSDLYLSIDIVENPEINLRSGSGTLLSAEEIALAVRSHLHHFAIEDSICLYQDKNSVAAIPGLEERWPGCLGYTVTMRGRLSESAMLKVPLPALTSPEQTVTLADVSPAQVYYTVDQTLPIPSNQSAILFTAPFTVPAGTIVRWAAFRTGYVPSDIGKARIT
jgi:hypothetical protein